MLLPDAPRNLWKTTKIRRAVYCLQRNFHAYRWLAYRLLLEDAEVDHVAADIKPRLQQWVLDNIPETMMRDLSVLGDRFVGILAILNVSDSEKVAWAVRMEKMGLFRKEPK